MSEKKYDILVVGELNVDLILDKMTSFPEMGKEKIAKEMSVVLGSSSAILASNLSSLGAKVGFIGKIGKDLFGDVIVKALDSKGVDTSLILQSDKESTGATIVMSFGNDRANITYPGAMETLTIQDISEEVITQARHLHFSSYFLQPGIQKDVVKLFKLAKKLGLTTSLDPQWDPSEEWDMNLNELLPYTDFFLPNVSELAAITRIHDLDSALSTIKNYNTIIIKMGIEGTYYYKDNQKTLYPAFVNNEVVDTVGAGDSFNAGFLFKFLKGSPIKECMTFASLTGAVSTTAVGGTGAFQSYDYVLEIINTKFANKESHEATR